MLYHETHLLGNILIAETCTLWVTKHLLHTEQKNKRPKNIIFDHHHHHHHHHHVHEGLGVFPVP